MQLLNVIDTIGSPIRHMIISTDDLFIIIVCDDTSVQVKSLVTGSDIHNLEGHSSEVKETFSSFLMIISHLFFCF